MYKNYKIVVNTAAGRRRYMQYLIPYVVSSSIVDRYDIWINTHDGADIEFFRQVAKEFSVINLVLQPDGIVDGINSINAFYKHCIDEDTIYFKLDDDIVWMEPDLIEKMVKFRIDNPHYFLVTPLVINNSLTTYLLQIEGKINLDAYYGSSATHPILWKSGQFARDLHNWFIDNYLVPKRWANLYIGKKEMGMTRFSINSILWFGKDMKRFNGIVPGDDEEFLSCIYPVKNGLSNAWNGSAIIAHFAFFTQREQLDKAYILDKYGEICRRRGSEDVKFDLINRKIALIMNNIQENIQKLSTNKSPYRKVIRKQTLRSRIKKFIPQIILDFSIYRKAHNGSNHIKSV